jgi:RHS repeat-associated protein
MYIYLSNEDPTPAEVYFDDFKVTQVKSPVVQMDDYYPFGLAFNSFSRENSLKQDFKYNGKELQDELNLGWLDYGARMYMADVGRWAVVDEKAEKYYPLSVYNYALCNPIIFIDPDGREVIDVIGGYKYTGNEAIAIFSLLALNKPNVYMALNTDEKLRNSTNEKSKQGYYGNWSVYAAKNIKELNFLTGFMPVLK